MSPSNTTYTLSDLLTAYEREYLVRKAPVTRYQHAQIFAWLKRDLGAMPLGLFTPAFFRAWRDKLSTRYAPGTVRRYMAALSAPFAVAVRDYEWLSSNPLTKVLKPAASPGRLRCLSPEEHTALLRACQGSRNPHLYTIVLLALSTGARKGQLRFLRWRDLDFERGVIRLDASKRTAPRCVPLLGPVVRLLQEQCTQRTPEAWVFARFDGLKPIYIDEAFGVACKRAGLKDFRFHDLRHSCASYLAMSGASLRDIAEILGHKNIQMTMRYTHLTEGHTAKILGTMVDRFLACLLGAGTLLTLASVGLVSG